MTNMFQMGWNDQLVTFSTENVGVCWNGSEVQLARRFLGIPVMKINNGAVIGGHVFFNVDTVDSGRFCVCVLVYLV